ncbi:MAG: bifunctional methylenetetrahydrofolate dehydrogenase/methenyltetrahydrofolate cyclohydrolase [Mycoplasmataceae bacterium]|nr:bifunctional methylenetetrahydrofolate dehydrogenase/methenyltetrahydrofolate cyclohydrolase [Mycoplasmataceae bacterium]
MLLINGKEISEKICGELNHKIDFLKNKGIIPTIALIQVGDNPASAVYVRNKIRLCDKLGIVGQLHHLEESTSEADLIALINRLNDDDKVNGILVQLPVPKHIDENKVIDAISPNKDVDCFHAKNVGLLWTAKRDFNGILPCTPYGVIQMLKRSNIELKGKNVVIIGRSNIVGKPLASLFLLENATVTVCHSGTQNLAQICAKADVLVPCIGKAKFVTKEFTNPYQVIIDVGINRDENGKLCGDVDFENVKDSVYAISPVPGGVGPMTIIMLLNNLINVTYAQNNL